MQKALVSPTPWQARTAVATMLKDQPASIVDTAQLLISEVVTNAIVHAGGAQQLNIERLEGSLRIEVVDASPVFPSIRPIDVGEQKGRGMFLLAQLASSWEAFPAGQGKIVSFEVRLQP